MEDTASVRCKACDTLFTTKWIAEHNRWEDMCTHCILQSESEYDPDWQDLVPFQELYELNRDWD